jgi:hypothetical protein
MKKIIVDTKECTPFTLLCKEKCPGGREINIFLFYIYGFFVDISVYQFLDFPYK